MTVRNKLSDFSQESNLKYIFILLQSKLSSASRTTSIVHRRYKSPCICQPSYAKEREMTKLGTLSIEDGECHGRSIDGKRGNLGTTLSPPAFVT